MPLTTAELQALHDDGFVVLRDVLPQSLRGPAMRRINHYLATINHDTEGKNYGLMQAVGESDEIRALYEHSPARPLAESLIGEGKCEPAPAAQMALRYPVLGELPPGRNDNWHLDSLLRGDGEPTSSGPANFTLLVGMFLSDVATPGRGNFLVRPGGHLALAAHFRKRGTSSETIKEARHVKLAPPHEVCCNPGDVVFCHHMVPHSSAGNTSPDIRYTCFLRLRRAGREPFVREMLTDPFCEWDGMPAAMQQTTPPSHAGRPN